MSPCPLSDSDYKPIDGMTKSERLDIATRKLLDSDLPDGVYHWVCDYRLTKSGTGAPAPTSTPTPVPTPTPIPTPVPTPTPDPNEPANPYSYGWNQLPGTKIRSVCPPNNFGGVVYDFAFYCKYVTTAWSGAAYDTKRSRMYIWGGGHADYYGNEVYSLDVLAGTMTRVTDPAVPIAQGMPGIVSELAPNNGTQPNCRHTYQGLQYIAEGDVMWAFSGSLCGIGNGDNVTWFFNPSSKTWSRQSPSGSIPKAFAGLISATHPETKSIYMLNASAFHRYDYTATGGTWTTLKSSFPLLLDYSAVIEPLQNRLYAFGPKQNFYIDLSGADGYQQHNIATTGWSFSSIASPGLIWDPVIEKIVGLGSDGTLYTLDAQTLTWTKTLSVGAPTGVTWAVYDRFAYDPNLDVYVYYGVIDSNAFVFRPVRDGVVVAKPTAPGALTVSNNTYRAVLNWQPATSGIGIGHYKIIRDGSEVATTTQLTYPDDTVAVGESHTYKVAAVDPIGQTGPFSTPVSLAITEQQPTTPQGDCSQYTRNDLVLCETFDAPTWWQKWDKSQSKTDPKPATDGETSTVVSSGCVTGSCLEVHMRKDATWAMGLSYRLIKAGVHTDQAFLSYDIKLGPTWSPDSCDPVSGQIVSTGGKFPGLADPRVYPEEQCGNGAAKSDGINCWTARSQFGKPLTAGTVTRFGTYAYHPNQEGFTGDAGYWDSNRTATSPTLFGGIGDFAHMKASEWYRVEMQVRMNTPGYRNGILRGWVNGNLAYEKTNMEWRKPGHDDLHVRLVWFNVYKGGLIGGCQDGDVYFDNLVVSTISRLG